MCKISRILDFLLHSGIKYFLNIKLREIRLETTGNLKDTFLHKYTTLVISGEMW